MRDDDERPPLFRQLREEAHDVAAGGRVEVAGRLVGQDDLGVHRQGTRDGDPLHLTPGQLRRLVLHAVGEADPLEELLDPLPPPAGRHSAEEERQLDVLERGDLGEQVEVLKDESDSPVADVGQLIAREPRDVLPGQPVAARARRYRDSRSGSSESIFRIPRGRPRPRTPRRPGVRSIPFSASTLTFPVS